MDENQLEKIERYLANEMPLEEHKAFELQVAGDKELNDFIQLYTSIDRTMTAEPASPREDELRQTLQQMGKKYFTGQGNMRQMNFKRLMMAAAAILVIALGVFYFLSPNKTSPEKLYARFAEHALLNVQLRGNNADSLANAAAVKFNSRKYSEALPLLDEYLKQQPDDIQMKFAEAVCHLETGRFKEAEDFFSAMASGQTAYAASAQWYLALLALKQKDIPKCRNILRQIPGTSSFSAKAGELLKALPG